MVLLLFATSLQGQSLARERYRIVASETEYEICLIHHKAGFVPSAVPAGEALAFPQAIRPVEAGFVPSSGPGAAQSAMFGTGAIGGLVGSVTPIVVFHTQA
jgi:hypothetical protein